MALAPAPLCFVALRFGSRLVDFVAGALVFFVAGARAGGLAFFTGALDVALGVGLRRVRVLVPTFVSSAGSSSPAATEVDR